MLQLTVSVRCTRFEIFINSASIYSISLSTVAMYIAIMCILYYMYLYIFNYVFCIDNTHCVHSYTHT